MIVITDARNLDSVKDHLEEVKVYNFSSLLEGYERCDILPLNNRDISHIEDVQAFDISYANYIINNDIPFMEFFKVIFRVYKGENVCLLVEFSEDFDFITETYVKLLSTRYGLACNYVKEIEDLEVLKDSDFDTVHGLYNIDIDRDRYHTLLGEPEEC